MSAGGKRGLRRALRADTLLILLVLACVGMLSGWFSGKDAPALISEIAEQWHLAPTEHDFGESDAAANAQMSDAEVNSRLAAMPAAAKCEPLRFLMLNAQNYFVKEDTQRSRYRLSMKKEESREAVAEVIASASPQVVGLIEIGGPHALADLKQRLKNRGADYPYSKILLRSGEDRALAVLSQYPIVQDHSRANCSLLGNKRQKMLRGILDVTVQVEGTRFYRIMGAHLKSRVADDPAAATARRSAEARTLALYLQKEMRKQPKMPVLVYGDWNDGPTDAAQRIFTQGVSEDAALSSVKAVDSRGQSWTICYEAAQEYCVFDRIYVNSVLRSRRGRSCDSGVVDIPAATLAADHRAVWCELR